MFDSNRIIKSYKDEDLQSLKIWIPYNPIPKQSVRYGTITYRTKGQHKCPWSGNIVNHKKGDVMVVKTPHGIVRAKTFTYQEDSKFKKAKNDFILLMKSAMNRQKVKIFNEIVMIEKLLVIFSPLKSFSKSQLTAVNSGYFIHKATKPDLPDNLKKFLFDCMSGVVYKDDGIIVSEKETHKLFGKEPGYYIELKGK